MSCYVMSFEPPSAAEARAIHMRRRLGEALEYGFALLDAFDLPPLALDVIDDAIAALDALEADDEDREDDDPAEGTSLETSGRGFVRAGTDDEEEDDPAEDSDPAERDDDCGSEDEPYLWRYQHPRAVQIAAEVCHG